MSKRIISKFNKVKSVNNIIKSIDATHKNMGILHSMSRGDRLDIIYRQEMSKISSILLEENSIFEQSETIDFNQYERWLIDGGRY